MSSSKAVIKHHMLFFLRTTIHTYKDTPPDTQEGELESYVRYTFTFSQLNTFLKQTFKYTKRIQWISFHTHTYQYYWFDFLFFFFLLVLR